MEIPLATAQDRFGEGAQLALGPRFQLAAIRNGQGCHVMSGSFQKRCL